MNIDLDNGYKVFSIMPYLRQAVNVHFYYLHQNHGANEFIPAEDREKRRRMKTKLGEPTLEGKEVASKGVRE